MNQYSITAQSGKKLIQIDDGKHNPEPNYYKMGNNTTNKHKLKSIDLLLELENLSKNSLIVINWIKSQMIWDNFNKEIPFIIKLSLQNTTEKTIFKRGFKELQTLDLVRRVRRSHYMINPNALITNYEKQLKVWKTLK